MIRALMAVGSALLLAGCVTPYRMPSSVTETAQIDVSFTSEARICVSGKPYSLSKDREGNARIPAGERVILQRQIALYGYNVTYTCHPVVSFVPRPGERYLLNSEIVNHACHLEVYRKDSTHPVGLALVEQLPADCYAQ